MGKTDKRMGKKNIKKNETKYLLHKHALQQKSKKFSLLWGLKFFTYKKEVLKAKASRMSLT